MNNIERIRQLNDQLRRHHTGGAVVLTAGIAALEAELLHRIDQAVASYDSFGPSNDPYGEHDFGSVSVRGVTVIFKINYYDRDLQYHSPDPSDPTLTRRVMTVMLADEY